MLIKNVLSQLSGAAGFSRGKNFIEAAARKAVAAASGVATTAAATGSQLHDILTQYDVTNISPQEFSDLAQKLRQSGLLPDKDYQELAGIRADLDRDGVAAKQRVNLVDMYSKKLASLEQDFKAQEAKLGTAAAQTMDSTLRRRLDWLQKLSAIHASPEAATINALA
jgi:hypothetical protein